MTDTEQPRGKEERLARAQRAKQLLEDPLFKEAIERCHEIAYEVFRETRMDDEKALVRARILDLATTNVERALKEIINNGPQSVAPIDVMQMPPPEKPIRRVI